MPQHWFKSTASNHFAAGIALQGRRCPGGVDFAVSVGMAQHAFSGNGGGHDSTPEPRAFAPLERGTPQDTGLRTNERLVRERSLRAAVLIDAVRCILGGSGTHDPKDRQAAIRWVMSYDTRAPFSFHNVCESLGFNPSRVRRSVLAAITPGDASRLALGLDMLDPAPHRVAVRRPGRTRLRYAVLRGGRRA